MTTARRKAVDRLRRDQAYAARLAVLQVEADRAAPRRAGGRGGELPDERLQLFFTCAHPALAAEDRGALTLRCLAGLTTPEVARAFLVPTATMAKRIVRAKKKIREARIPFRVPGPDELPERLPGVLQVVYSIFTEGYAASSGPSPAARPGRGGDPAGPDPAPAAARRAGGHRAARADAADPRPPRRARPVREREPVLLEDQDRGRWDRRDDRGGRGPWWCAR